MLIIWMPVLDSEENRASSVPVALSWMPKAWGMEGPVTSASKMAAR